MRSERRVLHLGGFECALLIYSPSFLPFSFVSPPHPPSLFNQEPQVKGSSSCLRAVQDPDGTISDLYVTASRSPFILNLPQWYEWRQSRTGKINARACREFGSRASSFHGEGGVRWMRASPAPRQFEFWATWSMHSEGTQRILMSGVGAFQNLKTKSESDVASALTRLCSSIFDGLEMNWCKQRWRIYQLESKYINLWCCPSSF